MWTRSPAAASLTSERQVGLDPHALVVGDTRGGCLQGLADGDALPAGRARGRVGEDEQRVRRTAHASREVVEPEEALEALGVLFVALELLDQVELLVDQGGVAARERHEHLADLLTDLGFAGSQVDGLLVEVVDRSGELADLFVRGDVDPLDRARLGAGTDAVDRLGQVDVGDLEGALTDPADRVDQGAGDQEGERDGRGQGDRGQQRVEQGAALGRRTRCRRAPCRRRR